jgi:hypothetical protein
LLSESLSEVIVEHKPVCDCLVNLGYVVLILGEHRACVEFHTELSILVAHLHSHASVVVVDVLGVHALREGLVLSARVRARAIDVIVRLPKSEDRVRAVSVAAAVCIATTCSHVAAARSKCSLIYKRRCNSVQVHF